MRQKAATFKRSKGEHLVKLHQHLAPPTDVTDAAYKEGRSSQDDRERLGKDIKD
jgi:hypothetical protein